MPYATPQDMIDRFEEREMIQLTDRHDTGSIDSTVLAKALADADAEIDGHLMGRYTLPLASVPIVLTRYACDIARYFLYDNHATEQVSKRYDDARRFLVAIGKGDISLGLDSAQQKTPVGGGPKATDTSRVFTPDKLADY